MSGWVEYKLGNVAEKIGMGPFGSNIKISTFVHEGIPVISGTHLRGIRLEDKEYNFITLEHANKLQSANVYRGDVIFTHAGNIGQVAFIPYNSKYERYIISQRQFYVRCKKDALSPEYLTYYFKSVEGQYKLLANTNQTGVPSLAQPVSYLKTIDISLPPLPEQRAIAVVLSSLDDKIHLLHQQNKTLESIAGALWRKMFVEEADSGWKKGKLGDCGQIICGKTPSKKVADYFGGNVPFIKIPDMHGNIFIFETEDSLTEAGKESQQNKTIPAKSICVSCIATVGLVGINAFESQTNQQINTIIPIKESWLHFLFMLMRNMTCDLLASASGGTATDNLNTGDFSRIEISIPPENVIETFDKSVKGFFEKIYFNSIQIRTLSRLRDTLLPKLMSGEVRVKI